MEVTFKQEELRCLQRRCCELQEQEQTQELRLPDGMPDIGKVLLCWGQVLLRGKEWHSDHMSIAGGVMAWVLYAPEDGTEPRCMEAWLPFQSKWNIDGSEREGFIMADPLLRSLDARSVSARKIMVRCTVCTRGEALEMAQMPVYSAGQVEEDVQLLRSTYPMLLPVEAGEKAFTLDEELAMPSSQPPAAKILYYSLRPQITDYRVLTDKIVFRGVGSLHVLYRSVDGQLHQWDQDLPFSQFAELDRQVSPEAQAQVLPVLTNLELEQGEDGMLHLKVGIVAQYVIYDREMVELVQDAYSLRRAVEVKTQLLQAPAVLDHTRQTIRMEKTLDASGGRVVAAVVWPDHPRHERNGDCVTVELPCTFQMLYYDDAGSLQCVSARGAHQWDMDADAQSQMMGAVRGIGDPQSSFSADGAVIRCDVAVELMTEARQGLSMVTGLELGETEEPDPGRPSLILCRLDDDTLWELAKRCNSTVDAICRANGITQPPEGNPYLLVPVP